MSLSNRLIASLAALNGLLAVGFGAFAAHGVADLQAKDWLRTGALYALAHAAATLAVLPRSRLSALLMGAGALWFAATLWAMAFGAPHILGAVTPLGGLGMIAGWAVLLVTELRGRRPSGD